MNTEIVNTDTSAPEDETPEPTPEDLENILVSLKELLSSTGVEQSKIDACTTFDELQALIDNVDDFTGKDEEMQQMEEAMQMLDSITGIEEILSSKDPKVLLDPTNIKKMEIHLAQLKNTLKREKDNFQHELRKMQIPQAQKIQMLQKMNKDSKPILEDIENLSVLVAELKKTRKVIDKAILNNAQQLKQSLIPNN